MNSPNNCEPPKAYYDSTWEWFVQYQSNNPTSTEFYKEVYPHTKHQFALPKGISGILPWEFEDEWYQINPSAFVAAIPKGHILGLNGAVLTQDNKLIWDLSMEYERKTPAEHSIFHSGNLPVMKYAQENLGVMTYCASHNYFHWMMDVLPRLDLLHQSPITIDKFVFNTNPNLCFQEETFAILGIPENKRIHVDQNLHIEAVNLVVPSLPGYRSRYPKWAVEFVRRELLSKAKVSRSKEFEKIYISRNDANIRKVSNEDEVFSILDKYGFKKITLSNMSVVEQINVFASAKVVISPHGANLTNLLFCDPGTKVLELFAPSHVNLVYWVISNHVGLDYHFLVGEGERTPKYGFIQLGGWADILVNLPSFTQVLDMMNL